MGEAFLCRSGLQRYAVGDIFITTREGDPATLLGYGSWEQIKGRFLLAAGDGYAAGSTGGEKEHTLTETEMPAHRHVGVQYSGNGRPISLNDGNAGYQIGWGTAGSGLDEIITKNAGGSHPHNNMPPYLAVYMWLRVA